MMGFPISMFQSSAMQIIFSKTMDLIRMISALSLISRSKPALKIQSGVFHVGGSITTMMDGRIFLFQDITFSGGLGQIQKGHAIAFADFNMDGNQDVYSDIGGFFAGDVYQNALYENPGHGNNWIYMRFTGTTSNRLGVGAKVKLTFED